jgi:hypothetical protein
MRKEGREREERRGEERERKRNGMVIYNLFTSWHSTGSHKPKCKCSKTDCGRILYSTESQPLCPILTIT